MLSSAQTVYELLVVPARLPSQVLARLSAPELEAVPPENFAAPVPRL